MSGYVRNTDLAVSLAREAGAYWPEWNVIIPRVKCERSLSGASETIVLQALRDVYLERSLERARGMLGLERQVTLRAVPSTTMTKTYEVHRNGRKRREVWTRQPAKFVSEIETVVLAEDVPTYIGLNLESLSEKTNGPSWETRARLSNVTVMGGILCELFESNEFGYILLSNTDNINPEFEEVREFERRGGVLVPMRIVPRQFYGDALEVARRAKLLPQLFNRQSTV